MGKIFEETEEKENKREMSNNDKNEQNENNSPKRPFIQNENTPQVKTVHQPIKVEKKVGRNQPCPCGSGKKYKNCCMKNTQDSFFKKNGIKILILGTLLFLAANAIHSIIDRDPMPADWEWCDDCRAYKPPGHNKNKQ